MAGGMTHEEFEERALAWRNIETLCKKCGGAGGFSYGNTATWMGGIGGSMVTWGTCNLCWGSGDSTRPGVNLKQTMQDKRDMSVLMRRLVRKLAPGNSDLAESVNDYLRRKGL